MFASQFNYIYIRQFSFKLKAALVYTAIFYNGFYGR